MTPGVALVLLGVGVGALVLASRGAPRELPLRQRAIEAQETSARASQAARELMAQWSALEERCGPR